MRGDQKPFRDLSENGGGRFLAIVTVVTAVFTAGIQFLEYLRDSKPPDASSTQTIVKPVSEHQESTSDEVLIAERLYEDARKEVARSDARIDSCNARLAEARASSVSANYASVTLDSEVTAVQSGQRVIAEKMLQAKARLDIQERAVEACQSQLHHITEQVQEEIEADTEDHYQEIQSARNRRDEERTKMGGFALRASLQEESLLARKKRKRVEVVARQAFENEVSRKTLDQQSHLSELVAEFEIASSRVQHLSSDHSEYEQKLIRVRAEATEARMRSQQLKQKLVELEAELDSLVEVRRIREDAFNSCKEDLTSLLRKSRAPQKNTSTALLL